jgi:group I intron endonuclease
MDYVVYKAISPNGKIYIGVTNNFKRRIKEHMSSKYPFGHALRKYGKNNFVFEFEFFPDVESALERESQLITLEEVSSKKYYNCCVGGALSNVLLQSNPMHDPDVVKAHPNIWTSKNNPMKNPDSKRKMIESQTRKRVCILGENFEGIREAARAKNISRQLLVYRLKSPHFQEWYYL